MGSKQHIIIVSAAVDGSVRLKRTGYDIIILDTYTVRHRIKYQRAKQR